MKFRKLFYLLVLAFALTVWAPFVSSKNSSAYAQNRIGGFVFGVNRQPIPDLDVELQDDYYRTVGRTRTNSSGRYSFSGMREGRFTIRVITSGTDYEERQNTIEIMNFTGTDRQGNLRTSGYVSEQSDFYLKLRKGVTLTNVVVFAQEIPPEAKSKYEKAIAELEHKRVPEALSAFMAALEIFPTFYDALERLGTEYIKLGRPETFGAAAILFTKAVEVNPRGFNSWYGLAYSQYSLGNSPEAVKAVKKAIELKENAAEAIFLFGVLLKKTGKYDEAEKKLLKAKDLANGSIPSIHWELATLYGNNLNRYADAAKELKLFLKVQPDSKDAEKIRRLIADFEAKAK